MAARTPDSLFASWLARRKAGEEVELEELCARHPEHAAELRELHGQWTRLAEIQRRFGLEGSLAERLRTVHGSDVDPKVELEGEGPSDFTETLLGRLAGRTPSSGRYTLKGEVAHGGMGAVLRVWDEDLRRHLAMKVMLGKEDPEAEGDTPPVDKRQLARFLEEAQVTGQLDHPGIVPVHELGLDAEGQVFFTMKLVKGRTLGDVLDELHHHEGGEAGWTQTRVLGFVLKVCEAMSYAHAKGAIHRDLKPANVMVGKFGEVYVMDWGLAKILGREDERDLRIRPQATSEVVSDRREHAALAPDSPLYTMDGDIVGTPAYMPPEQAAGRVWEMCPASDVYALGAMLYHLLAGRMPYVPPGARVNAYAVLMRVQEGPPQPLSELAPGAPAELCAICERAMAREIDRRYGDTQALAADLAAFVEGRVVSAYETGAWAETKKWVQRNKPLAASLAAAVVLAVAGAGAVAYVQSEGKAAALEQQRIAEANERLAQTNEAEAERQATLAQENATRATEQARIATERAEDVLRLSALQDLEDLLADADALWPAHPENVEAYRAWILRGESLVRELPRHRAKRDELRALALPRGEEQQRAERASHPEHARLVRLQGGVDASRRALLQRRDRIAAELPAVDWSAHAQDASGLNAEAWPLIDPERSSCAKRFDCDVHEFGKEPLGLALAERAAELAAGDPELAATVGDILAWAHFALGRDEAARAASASALAAAPPERRAEFEGYLAKIEQAILAATADATLAAAGEELVALETKLASLEALVDGRLEWRFPEEHGEARWWNAQLTKLIDGLAALVAEDSGLLAPSAVSAEHGWSVAKRLAFAEDLSAGFAPGGAYAARWAEWISAIRTSPRYGGLVIEPQMGLVPIGQDPASGLHEFWHVATGAEPERDADGTLVLAEEMGVVLVLIPGGRFWMGAQKDDPDGRNYDPEAGSDEGPVYEVELSPYLLSKYELTQGQWQRVAGENPSYYQPPNNFAPSLLHPVEQVSWTMCKELLERIGLSLPSEAQWEHGARGGTSTPWWTGAERESLRGKVNLADQTAKHAGATWAEINDWPDLEDGSVVHGAVGKYAANLFGLHEVHGNVWEWCLDGYDGSFYGKSAGKDPVSPWEGSAYRVSRGGSFDYAARLARSAYRSTNTPADQDYTLGLRPSRALRLSSSPLHPPK